MRRGGALANSYIELLNSIEQKLLYSIEFRKLDQITNILKGQQLNKEKFIKGGEFPVYNGGKTYSGFYDKYNQEENSIILNQGGSAGLVSFIKTKFWASAHCFIIKPINQNFINNKFLFYLLKSKYDDISKLIRGTTILGINIEDLKNVQISIPSLEIQTKIVNILDKLQDYSKDIKTGLPLEIEQRKKQYEYYHDLLLDFKANAQGGALANSYIQLLNNLYKKIFYSFEYKSVKETFLNISTGKNNANAEVKGGKYAFWTCDEQPKKIDKYSYDGKAIIISGNGNVGNINLFFGKFDAYQRTYVLMNNISNTNIKFLYYYCKKSFKDYIKNYLFNSVIPYITLPMLQEFKIPIPSLEIQNKIVEILDKLSNYSKDIKTGLPLEIEQRQKQYKYYLNLLLKF